jgi:hypothetical protein
MICSFNPWAWKHIHRSLLSFDQLLRIRRNSGTSAWHPQFTRPSLIDSRTTSTSVWHSCVSIAILYVHGPVSTTWNSIAHMFHVFGRQIQCKKCNSSSLLALLRQLSCDIHLISNYSPSSLFRLLSRDTLSHCYFTHPPLNPYLFKYKDCPVIVV